MSIGRPDLNQIMHARMKIEELSKVVAIAGATEEQQGDVVRSQLMAIAEFALFAVSVWDLAKIRRRD